MKKYSSLEVVKIFNSIKFSDYEEAILFIGRFMLAVMLVTVNPVFAANGRDVKKEKEIRFEPTRALMFEFSQDFPKAKYVTWAYRQFAEASFLDNDVMRTAFYDEDNHLVGSTTDVDVTALPETGRDRITKTYPGYTIEKVIFFDDNEANDTDMFLFNQSFDDEDNYFPMLSNGSKQIILKVSPEGNVSFFRELK